MQLFSDYIAILFEYNGESYTKSSEELIKVPEAQTHNIFTGCSLS